MEINVVNKHHGAKGEYIGRGSPLGNPFPIGQFLSREDVVAEYRRYIAAKIEKNDPVIVNELTRLFYIAQERPLNLVCFCAPKACHGDVIKEILLSATPE